MKDYVNIQREKWETYGCTIMCDGWTGPTKLSIINFMVYSKGSTIFLKSVDASDKIKDNKYIYGLLKDAIKEVGEANVMQIVTDNGSAFVKAGKLLMKKYNLYWTPCAAHCIDLMFEDIGKRDSVAQLILTLSHSSRFSRITGNEITTFNKNFLNLGIFILQYFIPILWTVHLSSQVIGQARIYNFQITPPRN